MQKVPEMVRNYVSSAEKRREESRRIILDSAMDLFFTKGYEKTTTRDIILEAGILNGSLYNRFGSKEEILLAIVKEALDDFLAYSQETFSKGHPVLAFAVPGALLMYIASHSAKAAELIYSACCSRAAVDMYIRTYTEWARKVLDPGFLAEIEKEDPDLSSMKVSVLVGMVGNICGQYAQGSNVSLRDAYAICLDSARAIMGYEEFDPQAAVDVLMGTVGRSDITAFGVPLCEFPDYRRF